MNLLWIGMMVMSQSANVSRAQELYSGAQYAEALRILGDSCDTALDYVGCERVRGSVNSALGKREEAITAFARALQKDPTFRLPESVSPKLAELFSVGASLVERLKGITLEAVTTSLENNIWQLSSEGIGPGELVEGIEVVGVTLYFSPPGSDFFFPVPLRSKGDLWLGELSIGGADRAGLGHYYLALQLDHGEVFPVGDSKDAARVRVQREFDSTQFQAVTDSWSGGGPRGGMSSQPTWMSPAIVGSLLAVTAGVVVVGVIVWVSRPTPNPDQDTTPQATPSSGPQGVALLRW